MHVCAKANAASGSRASRQAKLATIMIRVSVPFKAAYHQILHASVSTAAQECVPSAHIGSTPARSCCSTQARLVLATLVQLQQ